MSHTNKNLKSYSKYHYPLAIVFLLLSVLPLLSACGNTSKADTPYPIMVSLAVDPNPAQTGKTIYVSAILNEIKSDTMNPEKSFPIEDAQSVTFVIASTDDHQPTEPRTVEAQHTIGGMYVAEIQLNTPGTYTIEAKIQARGETLTETTQFTVQP
ncbi:MAG: FixH family protein [Candidatus Carbobacillus sp.]|nr:FixH family protein [Candidatus Carbobacillus sp.]